MSKTKNLVLAGLFVALTMLFPVIFGQIPGLNWTFLPMHLPVLIAGFVCGWKYGALVGFIAPLLSLLTGHQSSLVSAIPMALELAVYGLLTGLIYLILTNKNVNLVANVYISLIISMLGGRIVYGIIKYAIVTMGISQSPYSFELFIAGTFIKVIPGIILQLVLIPILVITLKKAKLIK